jgi:hypothetical protein
MDAARGFAKRFVRFAGFAALNKAVFGKISIHAF